MIMKEAIVTPILKKHDLDPDDVKSYRPISNLTFISKVIERIVASQLTGYLQMNRLLPDHQSAYRQGHSTETALLKIFSDILDAADSAQVTLLGLLDLSAVFDTVDHDILLTRLHKSYGVGGTALAWISSFIQGRQQSVTFNGHQSTRIQLEYGVPQGSVLGPTPFHPVHLRCHLHCRITRCRSPLLCRRQPTLSPLPCHRPIDCRS